MVVRDNVCGQRNLSLAFLITTISGGGEGGTSCFSSYYFHSLIPFQSRKSVAIMWLTRGGLYTAFPWNLHEIYQNGSNSSREEDSEDETLSDVSCPDKL